MKVDTEGSGSLTWLLSQWTAGDPAALQSLIPIVYGELYRLAQRQLRSERSDHTLQSTALVNEAYLRLIGQESGPINSRTHFLGVAARVMRQILVDHARSRRAAKRDGGSRVELHENDHPLQEANIDVIALDDALKELATFDPDLCKIVEMRYLAGLSVDDTAEAMGVSPASVKREWVAARAWLGRRLSNSQ